MTPEELATLNAAVPQLSRGRMRFVLVTGSAPVLYLTKPTVAATVAFAQVRLTNKRAANAVTGMATVVQGKVVFTLDPEATIGSVAPGSDKRALKKVAEQAKNPLLKAARLVLPDGSEPEDAPEPAPEPSALDTWSGADEGGSDELKQVNTAIATLKAGDGDALANLRGAVGAVRAWLRKAGSANPRRAAMEKLEAELEEATTLATLKVVRERARKSNAGELMALLELISAAKGGPQVEAAKARSIQTVIHRMAKLDESKDREALKLLDLAERVQRAGGRAAGKEAADSIQRSYLQIGVEMEGRAKMEAFEKLRRRRHKDRRAVRAAIKARTARVEEEIGGGNFGSVHRLSVDGTDTPLCVKFGKSWDAEAEMIHEAAIYKKVGPHPNIVPCHGVHKLKDRYGLRQRGLVMEIQSGGTMKDRLAKARELVASGELSAEDYNTQMKGYMRGAVRGLIAMRDAGFAHLDIKADNIFIGEDGEARLGDLGLAARVGDLQPMAYHGHAQTSVAGPARDGFAFGATVLEEMRAMILDMQASAENRPLTAEDKSLYPEFRFDSPGFDGASAFLKGRKRAEDPTRNPTAFVNLVNGLLRKNTDAGPDGRGGEVARLKLEDILSHPFLADDDVTTAEGEKKLQTALETHQARLLGHVVSALDLDDEDSLSDSDSDSDSEWDSDPMSGPNDSPEGEGPTTSPVPTEKLEAWRTRLDGLVDTFFAAATTGDTNGVTAAAAQVQALYAEVDAVASDPATARSRGLEHIRQRVRSAQVGIRTFQTQSVGLSPELLATTFSHLVDDLHSDAETWLKSHPFPEDPTLALLRTWQGRLQTWSTGSLAERLRGAADERLAIFEEFNGLSLSPKYGSALDKLDLTLQRGVVTIGSWSELRSLRDRLDRDPAPTDDDIRSTLASFQARLKDMKEMCASKEFAAAWVDPLLALLA